MKYKLYVLSSAFMLLVASAALHGCSKANETALQQESNTTCDTAGMKLKADILPILTNNCFSCHSAQTYISSGSNINLEDFNMLKTEAVNGNLLNAVGHTGSVTPMPLDQPKLSDCEINKLQDWVNNGAQNN